MGITDQYVPNTPVSKNKQINLVITLDLDTQEA